MNEHSAPELQSRFRGNAIAIALLVLVLVAGAYLRLTGLGVRSLGHDESSTWHVSRMPLGESLRWQPELTKPPLYQFALRGLTDAARPTEWQLRLPAALSGVLLIAAVWWLVRSDAGALTALALSGLVAFSAVQIEYSQEARPYSMMVLGCTVSMALWYRLVVKPQRRFLLGYVLVTALTFHTHYLAVLTIAAQALWWIMIPKRQCNVRHPYWPPVAIGSALLLCAPIVVHYLVVRSSVFQGLAWIDPPTWRSTLGVLETLTTGRLWVFALLVPSMALWVAAWLGWRRGGRLLAGSGDTRTGDTAADRAPDILGLLLLWFLWAWFGLLVISWLGRPAMVVRYALPASIPALALPLIVAYRWDRRIPLGISLLFVAAWAPDWVLQATEYEPGIRELSAYLNEHVDPRREGVVLTIDNTTYPNWEEMERAVFRYYPLDGIPIKELHLAPDGMTAKSDVLADPRALYLVVGWTDPFPILEAAGRRSQPILLDGRSFSQLLFQPYRLVYVAPMDVD